MIETTIHRQNPMIDPAFHAWGWEIPVYLFLGGLVAGLMILSGYHIIRALWDKDRAHGHYVTAPILSLALLTVGMGALFLDLEHKLYVWRLYLTFEVTSPMSWGSWILLLVYPALAASALLTLPQTFPKLARRLPFCSRCAGALHDCPRVVQAIGFANMLLGVMLGIYTGILLSTLSARPLWNSALLGPLFLFSGLSTGAATIHLLAHVRRPDSGSDDFSDAVLSALVNWLRPPAPGHVGTQKLEHADNSFLTVELLLLGLFIVGLLSSTEVHQRAVELILTGPYAAAFWVLVVGCGIVLPLTLQFLQAQHRIRSTVVPALLVIGGSLALRIVIVAAGQASAWTVASH
ncbi:MAG: polysulfide reductase NrfD [Opitutaceae bacterium]|nr:polysulfide reductase NrfD [Opitutaceae bacterium]